MSLQPLQRFFFERAKISDWQTEGNQCQVPIGGEDVGEGVSYKMMLRGWLFKRVKTLEICVIHSVARGRTSCKRDRELWRVPNRIHPHRRRHVQLLRTSRPVHSSGRLLRVHPARST